MDSPNLQFGKNLLSDFFMEPNSRNINHGSFGSCPKQVMQAKRVFQERMDANTDRWFRVECVGQLAKARGVVAEFINAPLQNVFMVENASDGFNGFMKSIIWQQGDVVAMPNTSYAMVKKTMEYLVNRYKIKILNITFTQQDFKSSENILLKIKDTINQFQGTVRMALCDHVGCFPGIIYPLQQIVQFYHEKGIPILVDGAHAVCQIDIDISKIDPDGYVADFHKWGFSPKQAGMLYISPRFIDKIHPAITGNFYGVKLEYQFGWTGTRDHSSCLSVPAALSYYKSFGEGAVRKHNHKLVMEAGKLIENIWKTKPLTDNEGLIGSLYDIEVPSTDINKCNQIANVMMVSHGCFPLVHEFDGKVFCRISAQIYNDITDYQFAAETFLSLLRSSEE